MNIHFLGSCSGTEPMPGRHHTSLVLEINDRLYFFDAGETCGYTAHLMGLDLKKMHAVIISHPHMDHVGGLPNLLWYVRKLCSLDKTKPLGHDIEIYVPHMDTYDGTMTILRQTEGGFSLDFEIHPHLVRDGIVFENQDLKVTARHNRHLPHSDGEPWLSYSFMIETEGKKIVYSGDVKSVEELYDWLDCDLLLMETGHHKPAEVAQYLTTCGKTVQTLYFVHHGRLILKDRDAELKTVRAVFGANAFIAEDATTYTLS